MANPFKKETPLAREPAAQLPVRQTVENASGPRGTRRFALLAGGLAVALAGLFFVFHAAPALSNLPTAAPAAAPSKMAAVAEPAAPAAAPQNAWQSFTIQSGDTLSALFSRAGLVQTECPRVMALGKPVETLRLLHPGEQIRLRHDADGSLLALSYTADPLHILEVSAAGSDLQARLQELPLTTERTSVSDVVDNNLLQALLRAGLSSATAAEFVQIFHWRVDFRREVRRGTRFSVVYDRRRVENRELSPGPIVAAELVLHDRTLQAFRFVDGDGEAGYYDDRGASLHPTLLRTPVHYTRISSPFSLNRFDPVVQVWRPHTGVDLAAAIGTPVVAAGDGRIAFIGPGGGYGNLIEISNFGPYSTRYAHLRRFAAGLHQGSRVHQGEVIGYVGESGEATGPHLHFEIRVDGVPRDPLKVALPAGAPLAPPAKHRFEAAIQPLLSLLDSPGKRPQQLASNDQRPTHSL